MSDDVLGTTDNKPVDDDVLGSSTEVEDITEDVTPEDFDFDAFVAGVRPGRRAVRVTMRADLVAEIDKLAVEADTIEDSNGDEMWALYERLQDLKQQIFDSQRTFVVEGRSDHRRREVAKRLEKLGVDKPGKKASEDEVRDYNHELALHCLADAIVVPSNVTVEGLRKLYEISSSEVDKLSGAFLDASTNPTKGVDPNLSPRR